MAPAAPLPTAATGRAPTLTRDDIVETARAMVLAGGVDALTMRKLSDELGTAVTSIYWHVVNRDALLHLVVDRLLDELGAVRPVGKNPKARIASLARLWRTTLVERPHLVGLAHRQHRSSAMFQPMQRALAEELARLGLKGQEAAFAVRTIQCHVVASLLLERTAGHDEMADLTAWPDAPDAPDDAAFVAALAEPPDYLAVFEFGLEAILATLP